MESVNISTIFSKEEWMEIKARGKKDFIIQSAGMYILFIALISAIINVLIALIYKIKPELQLFIYVFVIQPIFIATIYSFVSIHSTYKLNSMIHDSQQKDRKLYRKVFLEENFASTFIGMFIIVANIHSLLNLDILNLTQMFLAGIVFSIAAALVKIKRNFDEIYEQILNRLGL